MEQQMQGSLHRAQRTILACVPHPSLHSSPCFLVPILTPCMFQNTPHPSLRLPGYALLPAVTLASLSWTASAYILLETLHASSMKPRLVLFSTRKKHLEVISSSQDVEQLLAPLPTFVLITSLMRPPQFAALCPARIASGEQEPNFSSCFFPALLRYN